MRSHEFTLTVRTADEHDAPEPESLASALYERFGDRESEVVFAVEEVERVEGRGRA